MIKKLFMVLMAAILFTTCVTSPVSASLPEQDEIDASSYLNMYGASLISPGVSGHLDVVYQVAATGTMSKVGVQKIVVRYSNGTIYQTIWGSIANGLLKANHWFHSGVYRLNLPSGTSFYCSVTFIAKDSSGSDTRTISTSLVTCP